MIEQLNLSSVTALFMFIHYNRDYRKRKPNKKFNYCKQITRGTGIRGLMRGMASLPQGNQELLVVRDKAGRHPRELGVSKNVIFSLQCFDTVGWVTGRTSGL